MRTHAYKQIHTQTYIQHTHTHNIHNIHVIHTSIHREVRAASPPIRPLLHRPYRSLTSTRLTEKHHYDLQLRAQVEPSIAAAKADKKKRASVGDAGYEPKKKKKERERDE